MKVYDVYHKGSSRIIRRGLTEKQMDIAWKHLNWWEKNIIEVKEREIKGQPEMER